MGKTLRIISLPDGVTAEEWRNTTFEAESEETCEDLIGATVIAEDEMLHEEKLPTWGMFEQEDWVDDEAVVLKPHHIKSALEDLQGLVARVAKMPFTPEPPICHRKREPPMWFEKYDFEGSKENVAICKEVAKVLLRPEHFNYPWQTDRPFGVPNMIEALRKVRAFMESNPDRVVMALYY